MNAPETLPADDPVPGFDEPGDDADESVNPDVAPPELPDDEGLEPIEIESDR